MTNTRQRSLVDGCYRQVADANPRSAKQKKGPKPLRLEHSPFGQRGDIAAGDDQVV